jgi:hypothetical protein
MSGLCHPSTQIEKKQRHKMGTICFKPATEKEQPTETTPTNTTNHRVLLLG